MLYSLPLAGKVPQFWRVTFTAGVMVYWRVAEFLAKRGWTRYRLVKESGLPATTVYRLANPGQTVHRIDGRTLDVLCATLRCGVGEIVEHVPGEPKKRRRAG